MGYALFAGDAYDGVAIGLYFGIVFVAGHLNQEVRDCDGDTAIGLSTNATAFSKRPVFLASYMLFGLSYAYLFALSQAGLCPGVLRWVLVLFAAHTVYFWRTLSSGLTYDSVIRFQNTYRVIFALIGLVMGVSLLIA